MKQLVTTYISEEVIELIEAIAKKYDWSRSKMIAKLINKGIENEQRTDK